MWKQRLVSKSESMWRARNINPVGHTRLPRYARGREGVIARRHGIFVFPDTNAHFSANPLSTCIRCGLRRGNYGVMLPHRKIVFILTCGTAILSTSDLQADPERIASLPSLPRDHDGPVFAEPWQRKPSHSRCSFRHKVISLGKSGARRLPMNSNPLPIAASRTMARVITSIGWRPWSG